MIPSDAEVSKSQAAQMVLSTAAPHRAAIRPSESCTQGAELRSSLQPLRCNIL